MKYLPATLTTLRLLLGPVALAGALTGVSRWLYLPLLITGTLSDIFDGILARRLGVATAALRRYDSLTDVIYYLFILGAAWQLCRPAITQHWMLLGLILLSHVAVVAVGFAKFGKYPAAHSWLAKGYGLCLLAGLIALLVFDAGGWVICVLAAVALTTNAEIIAIHLCMETPPVDVKSIWALPKTGK